MDLQEGQYRKSRAEGRPEELKVETDSEVGLELAYRRTFAVKKAVLPFERLIPVSLDVLIPIDPDDRRGAFGQESSSVIVQGTGVVDEEPVRIDFVFQPWQLDVSPQGLIAREGIPPLLAHFDEIPSEMRRGLVVREDGVPANLGEELVRKVLDEVALQTVFTCLLVGLESKLGDRTTS